MDVVKNLILMLKHKSQTVMFSKAVIATSLFFIIGLDIAIFVIVAQNLDNTRLSLAYYTIFFIFQVLWTYSSWIVFLILFYFKYEDVPKWVSSWMYSDWEWRSMKRFWECLCLRGKCFFTFSIIYTCRYKKLVFTSKQGISKIDEIL